MVGIIWYEVLNKQINLIVLGYINGDNNIVNRNGGAVSLKNGVISN